jgi:hypothetical protein
MIMIKRITRLAAIVLAAACLTAAPALASPLGDSLTKLVPAPLDGWKAPFKPAWRGDDKRGTAFSTYRQAKSKAKVQVLYRWNPFTLSSVKTMLGDEKAAKRAKWEHATIGGRKYLVRAREKGGFFAQTLVGDKLIVFVQTFDGDRKDVETYAKAVPYDKLAGIK